MRPLLLSTEHPDAAAKRKRFLSVPSVVKFMLLLLFLAPGTASACAVCFGNSDSPWAKALNWGILVLLFVVLSVLGGIVAFFMHMAKRSRMAQLPANPEELQP